MTRVFLVLAVALLVGRVLPAAQDDQVSVEIRGTLHSNLSAGQAMIEAGGHFYSLDFGANDNLRRQAERMDRNAVLASGSLIVQRVPNACPQMVVLVDRLAELGPAPVRYHEERPVILEREVIREERRRPFVKLPGIEINP